MTVLNFTAAAKYILTLMLAMLGYIPYEALESNPNQNDQKELAQFEFEELSCQYDTTVYFYEFNDEFEKFKVIEPLYTMAFTNDDSLSFMIIHKKLDSLAVDKELVVIME